MTHDAYKEFIDEMVSIASRSVTADRIRASGHPVRVNERDSPLSNDEAALKSAFSRLTAEERTVLAQAFTEERQSALHDLASFLEWAAASEEMRISWRGETFGSSPYASMHFDFISRLNGDAWENA